MTPLTLLTRADAILSNSTRFYTGKPCKKGHNSQRYTKNGACVECLIGAGKFASPIASHHDERIALEKAKEERHAKSLELRTKLAAGVEERRADRLARRASQEACWSLNRTMCVIPHVSAVDFRNYAFLVASLRDDRLRFEHVALPALKSSNLGGGRGKYWVMAFPEDYDALQAYARLLLEPTKPAPQLPTLTPLLEKVAEFRRTGFGENIAPEGRNFPDGDPK